MNRILLFGGTAEGRNLTEFLSDKQINTLLCVVSDYGKNLISENQYISVREGRIDEKQIEQLIESEDFSCAVDATHPFAKNATENIKTACEKCGLEYIRLSRDTKCDSSFEGLKAVWVDNMSSAAEYLSHKTGNIFVTTGSRDIDKLNVIPNFSERLYVRILPVCDSIEKCLKAGINEKNIICIHGPFSEKLNQCLIEETKSEYLLTKESGKTGGFFEKLSAAKKAGITAVIIKNSDLKGFSFEQVKSIINEKYSDNKHVYVIGIGCGDMSLLTEKSKKAIEQSNVIFGAERIIEPFIKLGKNCRSEYKADIIADEIEKSENNCFAALFSGDTGFYSGAEKLIKLLKDKKIKYDVLCGVSSYVYFMNTIGKSYEDAVFLSLHGKKCDYINAVRYNKKCIIIIGSGSDINKMCSDFIKYGLENLKIYVGENLSYNNEKITFGKPEDFINTEFSSLSIVYIENDFAKQRKIRIGISDDEFIRSNIPMTKSEIRAIVMSKLNLSEDSIVYDIGAGTGSVSIESALLAYRGKVLAVEKNSEAVELLNKNIVKFGAYNITLIYGTAPQILKECRCIPTHCFIGGSSGKMKEIVKYMYEKNPNVRFVITAITLETLNEAKLISEKLGYDMEIVQLFTAKNKKVGNYNMMKSDNPVYVISFGGDVK
ncbi:MAG: precorrin-6A reductase [Clostridia bacterium]|nr:precorrin-6A reductase [Clostridia bacterium]